MVGGRPEQGTRNIVHCYLAAVMGMADPGAKKAMQTLDELVRTRMELSFRVFIEVNCGYLSTDQASTQPIHYS